MTTTNNELTLIEWVNSLSADGVMNVGYDNDARLMKVMSALMTLNDKFFPKKKRTICSADVVEG